MPFILGENSDTEGLEGLATEGTRVRGGDARSRQDSGSDDSPGDALRHFSGADEAELVGAGRDGKSLH